MQTEQEFIEERRAGIGASDIGPILGVGPYGNAHRVFGQKLGIGPEFVASEEMQAGNDMEPWIATERFIPRIKKDLDTDIVVVKPPILRHPEHDWLFCHADGVCFVAGDTHILPYTDATGSRIWGNETALFGVEFKTVSDIMFRKGDWGEPGTDDVPEGYLLQCQICMAVTGLKKWYLAAWVGGNKFRLYIIEYNQDLFDAILPLLKAFWENCQNNIAPPVDDTDDGTVVLSHVYKEVVDEEIPATPKADEAAYRYQRAKAILADNKKIMTETRNIIADEMGTAAKMIGPDYRVINKFNKPTRKIHWEPIARQLVPTIPQKVVDEHTETIKPKTKRFTLTATGDK